MTNIYFFVYCRHEIYPKTMIGAGLANLHEGYRHIGLSTPTEVLEYDR